MDRYLIAIIILAVLSVGFFILQIGVKKDVDIWPINKISELFESEETEKMESTDIGGGSKELESGVDGGGEISEKQKYDVDEDGFLSCEFTAQEGYNITGNYIIINMEGSKISFSFEKILLETRLHPDNLPEVTLQYNLYPENPDEILYSNIFLADDGKLYVCY